MNKTMSEALSVTKPKDDEAGRDIIEKVARAITGKHRADHDAPSIINGQTITLKQWELNKIQAHAAIQAYEAHLSEQGAWQCISTAPKDGTEFMGWENGVRNIFFWDNDSSEWVEARNPESGAWGPNNPTKWTPLPQPSKAMITASQGE